MVYLSIKYRHKKGEELQLTNSKDHSNLLESLFFIIPLISASSRRLHDIGKSGWWYFTLQIIPIFLPQSLGFLSILTLFAYIYFMCEAGGPNNAYGQNPLEKGNEN